MNLWRGVGYALVGLVDALATTAIVTSTVYLTVEVGIVADAILPTVPTVVAAAAVTFVVSVLVGFVLASRGGKPFPLVRLAKYLRRRLPWWI